MAFWVISLVPPGEAQRSGFAGKRRSKGTSAVFATRRKRSRVDFATTSRRGQSRSPPAGGETSPAGNGTGLLSPPHPPPSGAPSPLWGKAYGRPKAAPTEWGTLRGGRVRTPAPTRIQGRPRFPRRGRSQTGPRAHTVRPCGGKRTGGAGPGPEKKSGAPVKNTGAPGQKQVKHTPPCCRFRPSGR